MTTGFAVLALSDGTTRVDLLSPGFGFRLKSWQPSFAPPKGGGVWHDGQLSDGRRLAVKKRGNTVDTFTLQIVGPLQDQTVQAEQDLDRLLEKAVEYSTTEWQNAPVWIEARANCETNTRYALICDYATPADANPYARPFAFLPSSALSDDFALSLEHDAWQSQPPGQGECVETANYQTNLENAPWASNTALPVGNVQAVIQTSTGRLLASSMTDRIVWRTDDGGATPWVASAAVAIGLQVLLEVSGRIYGAGAVGIYRSDDNGATWNLVNAARAGREHSFVYRSTDDYIYLLDDAVQAIYRSNDLGVNWTLVSGAIASITSLSIGPGGALFCRTTSGVVYASVNGTTWTVVTTLGDAVEDGWFFYPGDGWFYYAPLVTGIGVSFLYRSSDGINWTAAVDPSSTNNRTYDMFYSSSGYLYATQVTSGKVYQSLPGGLSWREVCDMGALAFQLAERTATRRMYAGAHDSVWAQGFVVTQTIGQTATCSDSTYTANKSNLAQLTHAYVYDAAPVTWTRIFPAGAYPFNVLPAVPAIGDIAYFGIQSTAPNFGPFNNLVFNLDPPMVATAPTIAWEYSQGAGAWGALTVTDNTNLFFANGANSVHWVPPADWATDAVNGVTGLWVRARLTGAAALVSAPQQATHEIYTVNQSGLAIRTADVLGDLPALLHAWLHNRSDEDGVGGAAPDAWANRYLLGLRSDRRGAYFNPFLNFSDTQQPVGVVVAGTAATVAAANIQTATGRQYTHTGTGASTWSDQFTFTLSATLAASFYGRFRILLRAQQHNCHVGDVRVRLKAVYGSGGLSYTGDWTAFVSLSDWQLLDLGAFKFPPINVKDSDLGNQLQLVLQLWSNDATADVHLYDLAFIPIDEWSGDFVDRTLVSGSEVGAGYQFDLDSVGYPKENIRALVRSIGSDVGMIKGIYQPVAIGPAVLQANAAQHLYVLTARYDSSVWYSEPWVCHSAKLQAAFRYLSMRGAR